MPFQVIYSLGILTQSTGNCFKGSKLTCQFQRPPLPNGPNNLTSISTRQKPGKKLRSIGNLYPGTKSGQSHWTFQKECLPIHCLYGVGMVRLLQAVSLRYR